MRRKNKLFLDHLFSLPDVNYNSHLKHKRWRLNQNFDLYLYIEKNHIWMFILTSRKKVSSIYHIQETCYVLCMLYDAVIFKCIDCWMSYKTVSYFSAIVYLFLLPQCPIYFLYSLVVISEIIENVSWENSST